MIGIHGLAELKASRGRHETQRSVWAALGAVVWLVTFAYGETGADDSSGDTDVVAESPTEYSDHAFAGFWASACPNDFGLRIKPVGESKYEVQFCGPDGCDEAGSKRVTPIVGDPAFRVVAPDRIEISIGDAWKQLMRCRALAD